jgi:hypothetical protein
LFAVSFACTFALLSRCFFVSLSFLEWRTEREMYQRGSGKYDHKQETEETGGAEKREGSLQVSLEVVGSLS